MHICKGKEEGPEDVDRLRHEESGLNIAALAVLFCFLVLCVWRGVCLSLFYFFVLFVFFVFGLGICVFWGVCFLYMSVCLYFCLCMYVCMCFFVFWVDCFYTFSFFISMSTREFICLLVSIPVRMSVSDS